VFERLRQENESILEAFNLSGYAVRISKYNHLLETNDNEMREKIRRLLCFDGEVLLDEIRKGEFDKGYLENAVSKSLEEYASELKDVLSQCTE